MKTAMFYEKTTDSVVKCALCPHGCVLAPGQTGICTVRKNEAGTLYSLNYGEVTALALDPIEKKPLMRFYPGSKILSAGTFGCNFKCAFCQNWRISQKRPESQTMTPQELVNMASRLIPDGNIGIAYTYNEPSVWFEFIYESAALAQANGLKNVLVTNGYINRGPLLKLLPLIDAMNIDLKSFAGEFYEKICRGQIDFVKETIKLCAGFCHIEVTTLLIPGYNDSDEEIEAIAHWLSSISSDIPLHLSRYHPDYMMREPDTVNGKRMLSLSNIAKKHLKFVYLGNMP